MSPKAEPHWSEIPDPDLLPSLGHLLKPGEDLKAVSDWRETRYKTSRREVPKINPLTLRYDL